MRLRILSAPQGELKNRDVSVRINQRELARISYGRILYVVQPHRDSGRQEKVLRPLLQVPGIPVPDIEWNR